MPRIILQNGKGNKKTKRPKLADSDQNVIELRKLVKTLGTLETEKKKALRRIDEEKRILMVKYGNLVGQSEGSGTNETFVYSPGFRYRCNGEPRGQPRRGFSAPVQLNSNRQPFKDKSYVRQSTSDSTIYDLYNVPSETIRKEIEETEKALTEIRNSKELAEINNRISNVKSTLQFLKAHSNDSVKKYLPYMNYSVFSDDGKKGPRTKKPNCIACEFSLRSENEVRPKDYGDRHSKIKWKPVPHGRYVQPKISETCDLPQHSNTQVAGTKYTVQDRPGKTVKDLKSKVQSIGHTQSLQETRTMVGQKHQLIQQRENRRKHSEPKLSASEPSRSSRVKVASGKPASLLERPSKPHATDSAPILDPVQSEEYYRKVMLLSSVHQDDTLAKLRDLLRPSYSVQSEAQDVRSQLQRTRASAVRRTRLHHESLVERMKSQLNEQAEQNKVQMQNFLNQLPAPEVSIKRWRSSSGANMKHGSLYADPQSEAAEVNSSLESCELSSRFDSLDLNDEKSVRKYVNALLA